MLTLRRCLLAALLMGLVVGCQSKSNPGSSEDSKLTPWERKLQKAQEEPEGPKLRPAK
jgi:hypothetical protein